MKPTMVISLRLCASVVKKSCVCARMAPPIWPRRRYDDYGDRPGPDIGAIEP
jgi:hypothetical protein